MKISDAFGTPKSELRDEIKELKQKLDDKRNNFIAKSEILNQLKRFGLLFYLQPRGILEGYKKDKVSFDPIPFDHFPHDPNKYVAHTEHMVTGYGWTANTGSISRSEFWYGLNEINDLPIYREDDINIAQPLEVAKVKHRGQSGGSFNNYNNYLEEKEKIVGCYSEYETETVESDQLKESQESVEKTDKRGIENWEKYKYLIRTKTGIFTSRDEIDFGEYSHGRSLTVFEAK